MDEDNLCDCMSLVVFSCTYRKPNMVQLMLHLFVKQSGPGGLPIGRAAFGAMPGRSGVCWIGRSAEPLLGPGRVFTE